MHRTTRLLWVFVVAIAAGLLVDVTPAAASPDTAPEVNIRLEKTETCLDLASQSKNKAIRLVARECTEAATQQWNVNVLGAFTDPYQSPEPVESHRYNRVQIANNYSKKCIGVTYDRGYKLHQWDCRSTTGTINTSQMWDIVAAEDATDGYRLRNLRYRQCVTVAGSNDAAKLTPCGNSAGVAAPDNQITNFPGTNGNCTIQHEAPHGNWGKVTIRTSSQRCGDGQWLAVALCEDRLLDIKRGTTQPGDCHLRIEWFRGPFSDHQAVTTNVSPVWHPLNLSGSAPYGRYFETQAWYQGSWTRGGLRIHSPFFT